MKQEPVPLGSIKSFEGAGIYVIYYTGNYEPYSKLGELNRGGDGPTVPIYIGKAIPSGGRKGLADPEISAKGRKLFERLEMHRKSIEAVGNLELEDFVCRYLVVDDVWIPLGESLLIQRHRPRHRLRCGSHLRHQRHARRDRGDCLHRRRRRPVRRRLRPAPLHPRRPCLWRPSPRQRRPPPPRRLCSPGR